LAFSYPKHVFFQNKDDRDFFVQQKLVSPQQPILIPGSGIDLQRFSPRDDIPVAANKPFTFLLLARLLWDKGVGEFVEAARHIRQRYPNTRFQLLGQLDVANPAAIPRARVEQWQAEGIIDYLGKTDEVIPYLQQADCVVLPSYREGTPRSLLEAAAIGKPIVTTDAVGCRNVVEDGVTGFLCQIKNALDLADKMLRLLQLPATDREQMGLRGRAKMEREFDEQIVINAYLDALPDTRHNHLSAKTW